MVSNRSGVLIFVSSGAATHPVAGWSAYCAAKAGLDHFARNLAAEIDQRSLPIRVHMLYPAIVATAMQETVRGMSRERFARVNQFRVYHEDGALRPPEEPAKEFPDEALRRHRERFERPVYDKLSTAIVRLGTNMMVSKN